MLVLYLGILLRLFDISLGGKSDARVNFISNCNNTFSNSNPQLKKLGIFFAFRILKTLHLLLK